MRSTLSGPYTTDTAIWLSRQPERERQSSLRLTIGRCLKNNKDNDRPCSLLRIARRSWNKHYGRTERYSMMPTSVSCMSTAPDPNAGNMYSQVFNL